MEPWAVRENRLHLDIPGPDESIFALSNGYIGMRGNLDEGEPHAIPGTYLNGCYELRPLPYPEPGYGDPEAEQTLVNVPNGKLIRLLVDDEAFDVRHGQLEHHERVLDLRAGLLTREARCGPAGSAVRVKSTRMVSLARRAVAAICTRSPRSKEPVQVVLQSKLVANESPPARRPDRYGLHPAATTTRARTQPGQHRRHGHGVSDRGQRAAARRRDAARADRPARAAGAA